MDASGKILLEGKSAQIDLSTKAKGIYILNAHTNTGETIYAKVVKD